MDGISITWDVPEEMSWETLALFIGDGHVQMWRQESTARDRWDDDGGCQLTPVDRG